MFPRIKGCVVLISTILSQYKMKYKKTYKTISVRVYILNIETCCLNTNTPIY